MSLYRYAKIATGTHTLVVNKTLLNTNMCCKLIPSRQ
jgi:hypothetical protein